jgi:uncharacterized membrane protein YeaQ/YmgE (transglycosylase-associated protein family)
LSIWLIVGALFASWLVGKFVFGKGGFIHILLLCAVGVAFVQFVHDRLAARR